MKKCLAIILPAAWLLLPSAAQADILLNSYMSNTSFEVPVTTCCDFPTGWFQGGTATGDAGNWNPSLFQPSSGLTAPSGGQVGYINNYSGQGGTDGFSNYWYLAQTLDLSMSPGTVYTLIYGVARRTDLSDSAQFRVQINGNYDPVNCSTCYAITSASTGSFAAGTWKYYSVSYTAQDGDAGHHPTIYLVNDGRVAGAGLAQVEFDVPVPEPASGWLAGIQLGSLALIALFCRKRQAIQ